MTSPFDYKNRKSKLGEELEKTAKMRRAMTDWVERERANGREPCHLALDGSAHLTPLAKNNRGKK